MSTSPVNCPEVGPKECEEAVNSNRPVNLDLSKFSFPLPAITSIIHRVTGLALFVGVAFVLWAFEMSLSGEEGFNVIKDIMQGFLAKLILWGILSALLYHLVAGVKHLLMDAGIGETLEGGKLGAKITLVVSIVLILLAGVWIW
ncbi:succinate dehydrogenase, cytochrome b556 subunit [Alkalimarinus alittae]|uniref:succinate dehydrogenase, cytochrome b556 subunit n=1 Tax=Alkalimarinus alittae TaxID=2961619 RepID=UPI0038781967